MAALVRFSLENAAKSPIKHQLRLASSHGYVLLPEIPPDTPESNAIMRTSTEYPQFSKITPGHVVRGCAKLAINYDVQMSKHLKTLEDHSQAKTFENVYMPMEQLSVPLNHAWRTAKHLSYTNRGRFHKAFQRIHPQVERARNERWTNTSLYHALKEVNHEAKDMTEYQRRLNDMYLLELRLNGIELSGNDRQRFMFTISQLIEAKTNFRNNVMRTQNMFSQVVDNDYLVEDLPKSILASIAFDRSNPSQGPWKLTLDNPVYESMMEHCHDRMMRWNLWQAYNNRAGSSYQEQNLGNSKLLESILRFRRDIAKMLGYESFAQMSMETKMAGSVDNVKNMIGSLKDKFKPVALEELITLENFAKDEGFPHDLELWDIQYWRRRMREHLYKVDHSEIAEYFPLPTVLDGLFNLCNSLFGITVRKSTDEADRWNENVQFYKVFDDRGGSEIAAFYLDPYSRPGKMGGMWCETGRERSIVSDQPPLSYINMNLSPPTGDNPVLMTVSQVTQLFFEFGHGLQQMLTTVPYSEIAGQRGVEWDALQVCAGVMSKLLLTPQVLQKVSCHVDSGKPLSPEVVQRVIEDQRFLRGYDTMRQLYLGALDMELYSSTEQWRPCMQRLWSDFIPLQLSKENQHIFSLTPIFSEQYPAAYYSLKWSDMLATDVFQAFEEAELESPEKVKHVGRRFRETFLELGGGVSASEVFRRFRGRDPTLEPSYKYYGVD